MDVHKVKSVAKQVEARGTRLSKRVLETMKTISEVVGATLGPGGMPILIERQEVNMPGIVTKDGVTVFRSLGFDDSIAHTVMEAARDAAVRTVTEAGDGTTTATVLAEAIVRFTHDYVSKNPTVSPQKVVRRLEDVFTKEVEPAIRKLAVTKGHLSDATEFAVDATWNHILRGVAKVSANGDDKLADAVIECFDLVGDEGNVTIMEFSGPSSYKVERIRGFPIPMGFEDSCARFMNDFVNDAANQRVILDKPAYILYHGLITETTTLTSLLMRYAMAYGDEDPEYMQRKNAGLAPRLPPNVVVVATGFSESVLGWLAMNFKNAGSINVLPMLCPKTAIKNSEYHFLCDMAAITGATVLDPINAPLDQPERTPLPDILGFTDSFEMFRYRSNVIGRRDDDELLDWAEQVRGQIDAAESQYDRMLLQERYGKLTGGIAKLMVIGASNGELKEKRDRAEDAVCAVRGAIKHGVLPGGGWTLISLAEKLKRSDDPIVTGILVPALLEPVKKLYTNVGFNKDEIDDILAKIIGGLNDNRFGYTYDAMDGKFVDAFGSGLLDSTPAVLEAIRNSISIASLIGTLGGVVVFKRDVELERREAEATAEFIRNATVNEANERP